MKAIIQLVKDCSLTADGVHHSHIDEGMLVLLGIRDDDTEREADLLADRILKTRIFPDQNDRINLSVNDPTHTKDIMVVSNFTIYGNCSSSRRPDFLRSAKADIARPLYDYFLATIKMRAKEATEKENKRLINIADGVFGADMQISMTAEGPITVIIDSDELKK